MSARWLIPVVVTCAGLVACRAILGVEELELADAGGADATAADQNAGDSSVDAGKDALDVPDARATAIAACFLAVECRKCCKDEFEGLRDHEGNPATRTCMCKDNLCKPSCSDGGASSYCGGNGGPPPDCAPCLDDALVDGECTGGCTSAECQAGLSCMRACPKR